MLMQMLEAGGMEVLTDGIRSANEDNPRGYYEFERVKQIKEDQGWLEEAKGKAVKMVSMLLFDLPAGYRYKIVFMRREMGEILASQRVMLARLGQGDTAGVDDAVMGEKFAGHLEEMEEWLTGQGNMEVLYVRYDEVVADAAEQARAIAAFLGGGLDVKRMAGVCDRGLYRQRAATT